MLEFSHLLLSRTYESASRCPFDGDRIAKPAITLQGSSMKIADSDIDAVPGSAASLELIVDVDVWFSSPLARRSIDRPLGRG